MARTIILGNGGHARSLCYIHDIDYFVGPNDIVPEDAKIIIGIGDLDKRRSLYLKYQDRVLDDGVQIMQGVLLNDCTLGENVLLNTCCQIDHDCDIGNHCVISPGAILCGEVTLGDGCFIGAGAIILQGVSLDAGTYVPAGTLVCGRDDFRKPCKMVQRNGTSKAADCPVQGLSELSIG